MQPYPPGGIGRYRQLADADRRQPGIFAKVLLTVCTGGATDIVVRAEGEPKRLGGERGIRLGAELQNERNPADHIIPIGILIEEAVPGGGGFQRRQVGNDRRKAVDPAEGIVAGEGKARLRRRPALAVVVRGHGDWPIFLRLSSSISTMRIGVSACRLRVFLVRRADRGRSRSATSGRAGRERRPTQ
jgi:hypothetical protein